MVKGFGSRGGLRVLIALVTMATIATVVTSQLFPPVQFLTSGTDASNYANLAQQYARGHDAGREFLPPEVADGDVAALRAALLKPDDRARADGILTPFVFVDAEERIRFPHQHLQPRIAAALMRIGADPVTPHLDRALFGISIVLFGMIVWSLSASALASMLGGGLFAVLPSHVELARYPMSESVATALLLAMVLLATRQRTAALAALPLLALPHAREEFFVPLLAVLVYLTSMKPRFWVPVVVGLVLSTWVDLRTAATASEFVVGSFSFDPAWSWPTPSALADAASNPIEAPSLALPAALIGLLVGRSSTVMALLRSVTSRVVDMIRAHPWAPIALLVLITLVGDIYKADLPPFTLRYGLIRDARFATGWLLWSSAGLVLVFGLVGLVRWLPELTRRISAVAWLVLVPMVIGLVIDMHATPTNQLWWTRRFHPAAYPLLILGCSLLIATAAGRFRGRERGARGAFVGVLAVLVAVQFALVGDRYPQVRDGLLDGADIAATNHALDTIPAGAVVLLGFDGAGQKLPVLARTVHGQFAFVVWDPADLPEVHRVVASTGRPVYVDSFLLERSSLDDPPPVAVEVPNQDGFRSVPLATAGG